jgi:O-antigen/teichoic acid export membrane protein
MNREAILRDGLMLSGRRFWGALLGLAFTYMSAGLLGPKGLGLLAILRIIPSLAVIINFGWIDAACREILHLRGEGNDTGGGHLRAVAYTAEVGYSLLWLLPILGYSVVASDWVVRVGLWVAGVSLILMLFIRLMLNDIAIEKDFRLQARVGVLTAVLNLVLGLVAAWFWGALGLFAALTLVQFVEMGIYAKALKFSLTLTWDRKVLAKLTWIGLPIALLTFFGSATGVNLWIERAIIGSQDGLEALGLFVLSISVVNWIDMLIGELVVSFQSHFWETLGKRPAAAEILTLVQKPSLVLAFMAAILAVLVLTVIPPLIFIFLAKYRSMLSVLWIFVTGGLVVTLYKIPAIFLRSAFANQQIYFMFTRMIGSILYAGMLWLLVARFRLGLTGAAWSVLFLQVTVCILMMARAYPYYLESWRTACRFFGEQLLPMLLVGGIYGLCHWLVLDSGYLRSSNELTNILMVSVPTATLALIILISWMEHKTGMLRQLYRLLKDRNMAGRVIPDKSTAL